MVEGHAGREPEQRAGGEVDRVAEPVVDAARDEFAAGERLVAEPIGEWRPAGVVAEAAEAEAVDQADP